MSKISKEIQYIFNQCLYTYVDFKILADRALSASDTLSCALCLCFKYYINTADWHQIIRLTQHTTA